MKAGGTENFPQGRHKGETRNIVGEASGFGSGKQYAIAERLGVARETANRRIKALCDYRWQGKPIVKKVQGRTEKQTWNNVRYTILPISGLGMF